MDEDRPTPHVRDLVRTADRMEDLADTAELMGDDAGAARFRAGASARRLRAMALLDDEAGQAGAPGTDPAPGPGPAHAPRPGPAGD